MQYVALTKTTKNTLTDRGSKRAVANAAPGNAAKISQWPLEEVNSALGLLEAYYSREF